MKAVIPRFFSWYKNRFLQSAPQKNRRPAYRTTGMETGKVQLVKKAIGSAFLVLMTAIAGSFLFVLFFPLQDHPTRATPLPLLAEIHRASLNAAQAGIPFTANQVQELLAKQTEQPPYRSFHWQVIGRDAHWVVVCTTPTPESRFCRFLTDSALSGPSYVIASEETGYAILYPDGRISHAEF